MEDEEESVVLENSELYKYLSTQCPGEFDYVKREMDPDVDLLYQNASYDDQFKSPEMKVPPYYLDYLDSILESNVLLDDDISFLYSYSVDLVASHQHSRVWSGLLEGFLSIGSFTVFPLISSSLDSVVIDDLMVASKELLIEKRRHMKIVKLLSLLKSVHLYVKKSVQTILEESAMIKIMELKQKANDKVFISDKKKTELNLLKEVIAQCIVKHIDVTRKATMGMCHEMPLHFVDCKDQYLAWCTDSQLGIDKFHSYSSGKSIHGESNSGSIEALKNVYILMQSEMLRRLGLCFCPTLWSTDEDSEKLYGVFKILDDVIQSCFNILYNLKFYYKRHILPPLIERQKNLKDYSLIEGYNSVHKISISLSNLVKETQYLETFLESSGGIEEENCRVVLERINTLKRGLNDCTAGVNAAERYFIRRCGGEVIKKYNKEPEEPSLAKDTENNENGGEAIAVGKTDLSVADKDRVYYCITDGQNDNSPSNAVDFEGNGDAHFPDYVMRELRDALLSKKSEFEKREEGAVAGDPDYEKFLSTQPPPPPPPKLPRSKPVPIPNAKPPLSAQLDLQKSIAVKVADLSSQFMVRKEECFGSSDDETE